MKPRVTMITLGVEDLERAVEFYTGMGLTTPGIIGEEFEYGAVAFFDLQPGLKLAVWPRASLSHDCGLPVSEPGPTNMCLAHNLSSKAEVDQVVEQAKAAGAIIVKPPHDTFYGGYSSYFTDPDGHLWEATWNPDLLPQD